MKKFVVFVMLLLVMLVTSTFGFTSSPSAVDEAKKAAVPDVMPMTATTTGPLVRAMIRVHVHQQLRAELRKKHGIFKAESLAEDGVGLCTDKLIDGAAKTSGCKIPDDPTASDAVTGLPVTGKFIDAIIGFITSPQGQALIAMLVQLLLHALGA